MRRSRRCCACSPASTATSARPPSCSASAVPPSTTSCTGSACASAPTPLRSFDPRPFMTPSPRILVAAFCTALALAACGTSDPAGLVASAKKYLAESNPKSAIIQLKSALQKEPDNAEARFLLAQALLDGGDPVNAETEARKARELKYPDDAVVPLLARAMVQRDQPRTAVNEFGARKLGTPAARADLAASLALAQLRLGDKAAAERLVADAAREAPD